ncbi:MAG: cytochrome c biogenesis protein CcdA [Dehalococcoidales bacterium]|nr:cytochrome c biogenesis protein CcdA [Dehalococcoidales bacterium]
MKRPSVRIVARVFGLIVLGCAGVWVVVASVQDASHSQQPAGTIQAGSAAPSFNLTTLEGRGVSLADYRGKPLVLNFFASWCDPCREETPVVKAVSDEAAAGGYNILGIAIQDQRQSLNQYINEEGLSMPVAMDLNDRTARAYGLIGPPMTVFIDKTGIVRDVVMGPLTNDRVKQGLTTASAVSGAGNGAQTSNASQSPIGNKASILAGLAIALGAGLLSFLSPCVLPLLPAYMGYIAGVSSEAIDQPNAGPKRLPILYRTGAFTLGLVLVFVVLGFSASVIGAWLVAYRSLLARIGGLVVLAFGLHMLGIVPIPFLRGEFRPALNTRRWRFGGGILSAGALGAAFGIGWTPCVGPMLGTILVMAGQTGKTGIGVSLLLAYGIGLGLPFLFAGLAFSRALGAVASLKRRAGLIEKLSGALLVGTAVLLITGNLSTLTVWLQSKF